jgi:glycosyltransferase involved in cell wall biosynthesis
MENSKGVFKTSSIENNQASENIENSPLVSVVIPIYDRTNLLVESIESILKQTLRDYELLLVCDGSPQETLEIVKYYEKRVSNIRAFYFRTNSGNAERREKILQQILIKQNKQYNVLIENNHKFEELLNSGLYPLIKPFIPIGRFIQKIKSNILNKS